ncbi:F-box protein [Hordeum vulgare]|nr:F-box protein [Hordeum vulgare]
MLPQSLAGFFYTSSNEERFPETALHFFNVSGDQGRPFLYPSLAFMPSRRRPGLLDCCNGRPRPLPLPLVWRLLDGVTKVYMERR